MQIDILSEQEAAVLQELTAASSHIVVTCHKSPDGDALGSSLAWADYLRSQGKEPVVLIPDAYPDFLQWLPNTEKIIRYDKHREEGDLLLKTADLIFCLDFNEPSRVDEMQASLEASPALKVMIDHHLNPQMDTALTVSHPDLCSTSELVFRIVWQLGAFDAMPKTWAVAIYCGMMTDTGGFTFNSSRAEIFFIIGQLLTKHIDKDKIFRKVYNNYSSWAIRMRGYVMCHKLNVFDDRHAAYFAISRKDMRDFHFLKGDAEGLVNEPLRIKGMRLSISLREDDRKPNLVWVSLRSVDDFPCNRMAERYFNGGGHLNASGGRLLCSLDEAERITRQAIAEFEP
ncbi:MAG: DHH family phosphoesterase [Prevotella sp.]|nr:DHH family phosphoesterase [Prevotella sp.]